MTGNTIPPAIPTTIPALPQAASVDATARIIISQGGNTYSATIAQALAAAGSAPDTLLYLLLASSGLTPNARVFAYNNTQFQATDNGAGSTYVLALNYGAVSTPLADAATAVVGTALVPAHSDHQHPLNVTTTDPVAVYGLPSAGAAVYYARSDHNHGAPPAFTGANASVDGTLGGVAKPLAGQQDYGLFGDGTWRPVPGGGTVQSVALAMPSVFSVAGSPITVSGTFAVTLATQVANQIFAGPSTGADAAPTFRMLVAADIPTLDASKIGTGVFPLARGGTNAADAQGARLSILPSITGQANKALVVNAGETDFTYATVGVGSVTSVGLAGTAAEITVTGASPITTSGSWVLSLPTALTFTGKTIAGGAFTGGTWDNGIIGGSTPAAITGTTITGNAFVPNSSSVPTNGVYLSTANSPGIAANSALQVRFGGIANAVNYFRLSGGATGNNVELAATGSDANVALVFGTRGTGSQNFYTDIDGTPVRQVLISHTASATRYITLTGSNGGNPRIDTSAGDLALAAAGAVRATVGTGTNITVAPSTAIPAGGTVGLGYMFSSTASFGVFFGSGVPTLSAAQGSLYLRSDGAGTNYVNTNGGTTWTALATGSGFSLAQAQATALSF